MKSPISWVGGKSRMIKKLLPMLPDHSGYVEVFGGAGWLLFGKEPSKWEVLNDYDSNLMNFWLVVKTMNTVEPIRDLEKLDEMCDYLSRMEDGKRNYMLFKISINNARRISDLLKMRVSDVRDKMLVVLKI